MLKRNEIDNEIEIWTDHPDKKVGVEAIGIGIWSIIIMFLITLLIKFDYSMYEAYLLLLVFISPGILAIVSGIIALKKANKDKIVLRINSERIEVFKKKKNKIYYLNLIKSIYPYANAIFIRYIENNQETKNMIYLSPANTSLVLNAIKEFKPDVVIEGEDKSK